MSIITKIGDFAWFRELPAADLDRLEPQLIRRRFGPGQLVFDRGDDSRNLFFVVAGRLLAVHWTGDGREIIYSSIGPGSAFGELSAITGRPRSLSLYAQTDSELLEMPERLFHDAIDRHPSVRGHVLVELSSRIQSLTGRVHELTTFSVSQRVRAHLLRLALEAGVFTAGGVLNDPPTHAQIGNSIGANREAVSRALAELAAGGAVETSRKSIRILIPDALLP